MTLVAENPNFQKPTLRLFKKSATQEAAPQYPERPIAEQKLRWRRKISWEVARAIGNSEMSKKSIKKWVMHKRKQVEEAFDAKWPRIKVVAMLLTIFAQRNMPKPQRKPRVYDGKRDGNRQNEMRRASVKKDGGKRRDELKRDRAKQEGCKRPGAASEVRPVKCVTLRRRHVGTR